MLDTYGIKFNFIIANDTDIILDGQVIKYINMRENYKYLGLRVNINLNWSHDQKLATNNFISKLNKIKNRLFSPDIKVQVINTLIFPGWEYHANNYIFKKENRKLISLACKTNARRWFGLSRNISNAFIWAQNKDCGVA